LAAEEIRAALRDTFDRQQQIGTAARLVARHFTLGHPPDELIARLERALLREDAGFHAYQMLEAGVRQFREWGNVCNRAESRYSARLSCRLIGARWEVRGRNQGGNHAHRDPIARSLQAGSLEQGPLDRPEAPSQAERCLGGIVKLTATSDKGMKRSKQSHCGDRVAPLVGCLGSEDPQRGP
jgi:hypothetical protein